MADVANNSGSTTLRLRLSGCQRVSRQVVVWSVSLVGSGPLVLIGARAVHAEVAATSISSGSRLLAWTWLRALRLSGKPRRAVLAGVRRGARDEVATWVSLISFARAILPPPARRRR